MRRRGWLILTGAAIAFIYGGARSGNTRGTGFGLAALALIAVSYVISVHVHPRTRHTGFRSCNGTGEHRGTLFTWSHRRCPGCDGGRMIRWGTGQFGSPRMQGEYRRRRAARAKARAENRWR